MHPLHPIGFVRTGKHLKFEALHQPEESAAERHVLELSPGHGYEDGLRDLEGFSRIWLVWWFHKNTTWRPLILPPRGPARKRGVFATRSPHRPNALGITPVQLLAVEKSRLLLGPCDLVDGTPVFDIKPYIPAYDAFPDEKAGWIDELESSLASAPAWRVELGEPAREQADWLKTEHGIDFLPRLRELLSRDPSPHRTRRIRRGPAGTCWIGCGAWRAVFIADAPVVRILRLEPGYSLRLLHAPDNSGVPDLAAQLGLLARWPHPAGAADDSAPSEEGKV